MRIEPRMQSRAWRRGWGSANRFLEATEDHFVSIIRVGLAETKKFAEGYDAIFGKKKSTAKKDKPAAKGAAGKKKKKKK
jgi:hypothetical protein